MIWRRVAPERWPLGTPVAYSLPIPARTRQLERWVCHEPTGNEFALAQRHARTTAGLAATTGVGTGRRNRGCIDRNHDPRPGLLPPPLPHVAATRGHPASGLRSPIPSDSPLGR